MFCFHTETEKSHLNFTDYPEANPVVGLTEETYQQVHPRVTLRREKCTVFSQPE
jgi:hypothetical protein